MTKELKPSSGKKTAFLTNGAGSTGGQHVEECELPILISLYKAQVQVDQGPSHKTRYTETYRGESGEEPQTHGLRGRIPEQNTNGLCSKIKNRQMGPHKIAKLCKAKDTVNSTKRNQQTGKRSLSILHPIEH